MVLKKILLLFFIFSLYSNLKSQDLNDTIKENLIFFKIDLEKYEVIDTCIYKFLSSIANSFKGLEYSNKDYFISLEVRKSKQGINYFNIIPLPFQKSFLAFPESKYNGYIVFNNVLILISGVDKINFNIKKKPNQKFKTILSQIKIPIVMNICPTLLGFYLDCMDNAYHFEVLNIVLKEYKTENVKSINGQEFPCIKKIN